MKLIPVSSSNLRAVGYDPDTRRLQVEFHNGSVYEYYSVPASIHTGLMSAASHGSYFDAYIKKGPYQYRQLR